MSKTPVAAPAFAVRGLELRPGSAHRLRAWHLAGYFFPPREAWFELTIKADGCAPEINISPWRHGSTRDHPAQEATLAAIAPTWIASLERLLSPYRSRLLRRGRYAGTPYSLRKLSIGAKASLEENRPMSSKPALVSLSLVGLPGSGLRQIELLGETPTAKKRFSLVTDDRWHNGIFEPEAKADFPAADKIGRRLPALAQIIEPGTARGEEIALALHRAMPEAAALIDGIAQIF